MNRRQAVSMVLGAATVGTLVAATPAFADGTTVSINSVTPAVHLVKAPLADVGGKLIFSDSPETFSSTGAFYRDTATGVFRVFWHHQNESGQTVQVAAAITNTSSQPVMLFSQGAGVSTNYYPDVAGQGALASFMQTHKSKQFLATLAPGESYVVAASTPTDDTTSGIEEFDAVNQQGHDPATVTVTTLDYQTQPSNPTQVPILPGDGHARGSFAHFDRTGTIDYNTSAGNAYIQLSSAAFGQWSDSLPGEYEVGTDVVDGNQPVYDNGNYGILYNLVVNVNNDLHQPRQVIVYDNPAGGFGHYVMGWNEQLAESDWITYEQAWQFASFVTGAERNSYTLQTSLVGGSAGPQSIYFTNSSTTK